MKLFLLLTLCAFAAAKLSSDDWKQIKSPMDHPRYQNFLNKLYRKANLNHDVLRGGRIVGGQPAAENQFPYQVYGYFDDMWLCGGSIISDRFILTVNI